MKHTKSVNMYQRITELFHLCTEAGKASENMETPIRFDYEGKEYIIVAVDNQYIIRKGVEAFSMPDNYIYGFMFPLLKWTESQ